MQSSNYIKICLLYVTFAEKMYACSESVCQALMPDLFSGHLIIEGRESGLLFSRRGV